MLRLRALMAFSMVAFVSSVTACGPQGTMGECSSTEPCQGRGETCDTQNSVCVPKQIDTSTAENPAPATFTDKPIAFHRGRVCSVPASKAGDEFPVFMSPCLHPCLQVTNYTFKHSWSCIGSTCSAWGVMWVIANSTGQGCPADAFSDFDPASCQYNEPVEFTIKPVLSDGSPVSGSMTLEIPFLTNADIAQIAANPGDAMLIESKIDQYPIQDDRIVGGKPISLLPSDPAPPKTCGDNGQACDCTNIGL